jgi:NADPH-dependent ferric siderophore reductase
LENSTSAAFGLAVGLPAAATTAKPRRVARMVEVARVAELSPKMRRVYFKGESLAGFDKGLPASYIKLGFPDPGMSVPVIPSPDGPRPLMRTYTPRSFDKQEQVLAVDFVLHGTGPAATWAAGARPGYQIDPTVAHWVLVGDDSAMPAIETIIEQLPGSVKPDVLVEVVNAYERRTLGCIAAADIHWALRGGDARLAGDALLAALKQVKQPSADVRVYLACEASAMRRIKKWLVCHWQIDPAHVVGRGYWKLDNINHPDQDYGD